MSLSLIRVSLAAALLTAAACSSDSTAPATVPVTAELTVDASTAFTYVKLATVAQPVQVSNPSTSDVWDLGIFATTVTTNGGAAGPGGVSVYCVCNNATATTTDLQGFTAANQLAAFEGVTATQIPAEAQFSSDVLAPAIAGWFTGTPGSATVNTARSWIVRKGSTAVVLAKLRVTGIQNASTANAGIIAFEYAAESSPNGPFGAVQQHAVDVRNGPVYFDLTAGAVTSSSGAWDLRFSAWEIRANGGVSGTGTVSAVPDNTTPFAQIDAPYALTAPAVAFKKDAYSGVFSSQAWYRYNITGTDNQIWPTFNVYLVKRGTAIFKVQLTSYYGLNGAPRQVTLRYARLR